MPEPSSMCQSRLLLGKAPGESIFTLHCRLLYYNFNSGSGKPRQPVSDSLRGPNWRIHLNRTPYCLIPTLCTRFNTHRSNLGAAV
jgi:hypothetical protein